MLVNDCEYQMITLKNKVAAWDGKSAVDIKDIYQTSHQVTGFVDMLIRLMKEKSLQNGATWLLNAWLKSGNQLKKSQIRKICNMLYDLESWEARLHVLQSISYMSIEEDEKELLYDFLRMTLCDSNKFVRAWSYNGFYELAQQYPQYSEETKQYFEMAMRDEAASVKARIRNIMKKGF